MRMHTRFKPKTRACCILAAVVMSTATGAWAGPSVSMAPNAITVTPASDVTSVTVSVSGPGGMHFKTEGSGPIVIDTHDAYGDLLPDGQYTWEAVGTPALSADAKAAMALARATGDDTEVARMKLSGAIPTDTTTSGYFRIENGAILVPEGPEPPATLALSSTDGRPDGSTPGARTGSTGGGGTVDVGTDDRDVKTRDQVFADDLIVEGSACVGVDCVNGESFGFDTLRLKENNLRIKFDDTSTSASFPKNDWQLTANESDNGGAEKFSIDDVTGGRTPFTIEAGAPNNSLYVDGGGDVGLGTKTPVVELHVVDGDSPTLRLEQNGSSGFTPQTWDVAGNEAGFFVRDATNGSKLSLRIEPGSPEGSLWLHPDTVQVGTSSQNVGVGTASPSAKLNVLKNDTSGAPTFTLGTTGTSPAAVVWRADVGNEGSTFWNFTVAANENSFVINRTGGNGTEFTLTDQGYLSITGGLVTGTAGSCTAATPCDGVFDPDFNVESIDQHASYMWKNLHLAGVGATPSGQPINLTQKTTGILNELEKAHIYIAQLNDEIKDLTKDSAQKDAVIASLQAHVARIDAKLTGN